MLMLYNKIDKINLQARLNEGGQHMEKLYDCVTCKDKNCKICPASGRNPTVMDLTDSYRRSVKKGYYSSSVIERRDENGKFLGYSYNKPGE